MGHNTAYYNHTGQEMVLPQTAAAADTASATAARVAEKPVVVVPSRSRAWNQEKNLLINGSRYIEPMMDVKIEVPKVPEPDIALPQREINQPGTDWLTILLFLNLAILATIRTAFPKYMDNLFQSIFNYSTSFRMYEEKNYSVLHAAFRLEVYFYITLSVFLFQLVDYYNVDLPYKNIGLFLLCFAIVLLYFMVKKFIYKAIGFVVEGAGETGEFIFNMDNTNRVMGLALFPVVLLITFFPVSNLTIPVLLGIFIVAGFYFLLLHRGFLILLRKQFSILYLFLYFCTLEFLPLVLLYKIVVL